MIRELHGHLRADGLRFGLAVSRFNEFITSKLLAGAVDCLLRHGAKEGDLTAAYVPGAFDLPLVVKRLAESGRFHAVIGLGCVIRGQTPHFDYVAGEAAKGLSQVALATGVPVTFGVITADTLEQAIDRAGGKAGNKGFEAAATAIELANLLPMIQTP